MRSEDRYISLDIRGPRRIVQNEPKQILLKSERCIAALLYHYKVFPFFFLSFFFFFFLSFFFFSVFSPFLFQVSDCFEPFFRGRLPAALIYESK